MEYKLTLTVNGETYQRYNQHGNIGGISKRDPDYLERVVVALRETLTQAESELRAVASDSHLTRVFLNTK